MKKTLLYICLSAVLLVLMSCTQKNPSSDIPSSPVENNNNTTNSMQTPTQESYDSTTDELYHFKDISSKIAKAESLEDIKEIVSKNPDDVTFGDEKFWGQIYSDEKMNIAYMLETCSALKEITFTSFIEKFYSLWDEPSQDDFILNWVNLKWKSSRQLVQEYQGQNYCELPVFTYDDIKICSLDFDAKFVNESMKFYTGKLSQDELKSLLNTFDDNNLKQKFYKDFFLKLLNWDIKTPSDCFK